MAKTTTIEIPCGAEEAARALPARGADYHAGARSDVCYVGVEKRRYGSGEVIVIGGGNTRDRDALRAAVVKRLAGVSAAAAAPAPRRPSRVSRVGRAVPAKLPYDPRRFGRDDGYGNCVCCGCPMRDDVHYDCND